MKRLAFVITLLVGALLLRAAVDLPDWGDPNSPASRHVSPYFIENSVEQTAVPNFVTAVLADYRGYDTLGEVAVIFTAGIGVMLLLGRRRKRNPEDAE